MPRPQSTSIYHRWIVRGSYDLRSANESCGCVLEPCGDKVGDMLVSGGLDRLPWWSPDVSLSLLTIISCKFPAEGIAV